MPLTTVAANAKTAAIKEAFDDIGGPGASGATDMPPLPRRADKVKEGLAWEILVSKQLAGEAPKRFDKAVKAAIKGGVMFDHEKFPHEPETACVVFDGVVTRIDLTVGTGRDGINHDKYVAGLVAAKVDPKLLAALEANCGTTTAAPHKFTATLVHK